MQQQPRLASESEAPRPALKVTVLPRRVVLGVVGLVLLTVVALGLAWRLPDMTMLHFLGVAQAVPVLYLWLAWWGTQAAHSDGDAS